MNDQEFKELIHKFRDEAASVLHFQPRIEYLIDSDYCQATNKIIHNPGMMWERMKAVETLGQMLPNEPGLYMFVWRPELALNFSSVPEIERFCWVLYIGMAGKEDGTSSTIKSRYVGEYSKYVGKDAGCLWDNHAVDKREERLARYLTLRPLEFWYLVVEDVSQVLLLEKKLLRLLRPPLNQQHGQKMRLGKSIPAFEENQ